ncbi:YbaB/EbfC family nucleoid-associated protein [Actinoallomurus acaciae]|uniref:YbaB/EbfC family nucleoid-associated protein n=1 Tax=Actinoallomurus acaciae TaxID=502577 RepID=A0ABV5Y9L7_9ACTN
MSLVFDGDDNLLDQVLEQTRAAMARLREAQAALGRVVGEGKAADGRITATSDERGAITELRFDPRVKRLDRSTLGKEVLAALQEAQADAEHQRQEIVSKALEETAAMPEPLDETFVRRQVEQVTHEILGR